MFDFKQNYAVARKVAAEGMVLLKNQDNILPVKPTDRVKIVGQEGLELIKGGGGSAAVKCEYVKSLEEGLDEKANKGKVLFAKENAEADTAIVVFRRYGTEGKDRLLGEKVNQDTQEDVYTGEADDSVLDDYETSVGYFYPSARELELFARIEESKIQNVILILNIASVVDISFISKFPKIKAVLLTYLPGMEGGTAIADVLCGDVNPSGRLTDTIAYDYKDYPSAEYFDYDPDVTEYKEGIFVGYRYFETYAREKVMYPFGFGLSYTDFEFSNYSYDIRSDTITVSCDVKNIGPVSGKEVVQVYISAPKGNLTKPAIELKGYAKTKELQPGQTQKITVSFNTSDMASFDDTGVTGYKAAWVLEKGDYAIFVGKSVRDLYSCEKYNVAETMVAEQLTLRFDGSEYIDTTEDFHTDFKTDGIITLYDVAEKKADLHDFVAQLTPEELISLAQGQPPAFPLGTAGVGNLKKYMVPNPQTADGPAGIRRSVNTTCFPCGTLVASTWDNQLQFLMGSALGYEGVSTGIDIILAPSMNIHRNPLCGRNFEYFSEDPLITGKTAASLVKGVQSEGMCATVKHFAANNCEYRRKENSSNVSERALREIYLKGFEIVIKESNPAFVMSSYNQINGRYNSANPQLMKGVLRDEWGYEGAVMTDWRNEVPLDDEIIAGNNIKMPFGYPDQASIALGSYKKGKLSLKHLQENAIYVLNAVMKTRCFREKDFGNTHLMKNGEVEIPALDVNGISSTRICQKQREDGQWYLCRLGKDQRAQRTYVYYVIQAETAGIYTVSAEIATNCPKTQLWYYNESEEKLGTAFCDSAIDENKWYMIDTQIQLKEGDNVLKIVFANEPDKEYECVTWIKVPTEDVKLARLIIKREGEKP